MGLAALEILDKFLADFVNLVGRQAAAMDPTFARKMAPIAGQIIEIRCTEPAKVWHLVLGEKSIELRNGAATNPNVAIQGSAPKLIKALASGGSSTEIQIDGDETLLLDLGALIKGFHPDLVSPLGTVLGTQRANKVAAALEMGLSVFTNLALNLGEDIAHNASSKLADRFTSTKAFTDHLAELDALRLRVDRLSAKILNRERKARDTTNP